MKANTSTTGNMALESTLGKTADNTKATGITGNSTVKEYTDNLLELNVVADGRRASESLG